VNYIVYLPRSLQQLPFSYELASINGRENQRTTIWEVGTRSRYGTAYSSRTQRGTLLHGFISPQNVVAERIRKNPELN